MSILLDKRSRHTEREGVKYINYRPSERVSENILIIQKAFLIISSVSRQLGGIFGSHLLPKTTAD